VGSQTQREREKQKHLEHMTDIAAEAGSEGKPTCGSGTQNLILGHTGNQLLDNMELNQLLRQEKVTMDKRENQY
jgi:hypothetical protein